MRTIDYQNSAKDELNSIAAQDREQKNAAVWREAITKYAFGSHMANYSLVLSWCSGELSMVKIDYLIAHKPDELNLDWTDERPKLIDAILAARTWPNPTQERKRLGYLTRVQLLDELARLVTKEEYSKFSAAELKAGLAEYRAKESTFYFDSKGMRWPRLSSIIVPPGFVSATSTAEYLRYVIKTPAAGAILRDFVRKHGQEQVDNFLNS